MTKQRGYTLVELIVAVGLFALVMLLASGAYIMMISLNRQVQGIAIGINNLSFALETMTRDIRTGTLYNCGVAGGDCTSGGTSFSFTNSGGIPVKYDLAGTTLQRTASGIASGLTDPLSVSISKLTFYVTGTGKPASAVPDFEQPRVTIIVTGTVAGASGKPPQAFTVETGATMRGTDI
jgi:prepilin-type N-terminal cleavage/methylation domain-containing protein